MGKRVMKGCQGVTNIVGDTVPFEPKWTEYLVPVCKPVQGTPIPPRIKYRAISGEISIPANTLLMFFFFFFLSCYVILRLKNLYYLILLV